MEFQEALADQKLRHVIELTRCPGGSFLSLEDDLRHDGVWRVRRKRFDAEGNVSLFPSHHSYENHR